jgi:hypothetical protein
MISQGTSIPKPFKSKKPMTEILKKIITLLPLQAEESHYNNSVKTEDIISELTQEGFDHQESLITTQFIENLFKTLSLLNPESLEKKEWQFVSFPAQLIGLSLLNSLADDQQTLLNAKFWAPENTGSFLENRRVLFNQLEENRVNFHPQKDPQPIRYVHVAWGLIKIGDHFLFHPREDKKRPDVPNYVPVGGKLTLRDIEHHDTCESIKIMHSNTPSSIINDSLHNTLLREVEEETTLKNELDFSPELIWNLKPYKAVGGAKDVRAYTQYNIAIFSLSLTKTGFLKLLTEVKNSGALTWFSIDDLIEQRRSDGERPYVTALHAHHDGNKTLLRNDLNNFKNSYKNIFHTESQKITFPCEEKYFLKGTEKIHHQLTLAQTQLLLVLASHAKGLEWAPIDDSIVSLNYGWIHSHDSEIITELNLINKELTRNGLPRLIEIVDNEWFRITINPEKIYFTNSLFSISLGESKSDWKDESNVRIISKEIKSIIGATSKKIYSYKVNATLLQKFEILKVKTISTVDDSLYTQFRRFYKDNKVASLGVTNFIIQKEKKFKLLIEIERQH